MKRGTWAWATCALLLSAGAAHAAQVQLDSLAQEVRPCIDQIKRAYDDEQVKRPNGEDLNRCFEDYKRAHPELDRGLGEFAVWLGATASLERMEDAFGQMFQGAPAEQRVAPASADTGVQSVKAFDLMRAYENNELSADQIYKDQIYQIDGVVSKVRQDQSSGRVEVELKGDKFGMFNVYAVMEERFAQLAKRLRKNDRVSIRGKVLGVVQGMRVDVDNTELIDNLHTG